MKQKAVSKWGAFALLSFFAGLSLLFIGRFFILQTSGETHGQDLLMRAAAQYEREYILDAKRGDIVDRYGRIIAEDTQSYRVAAVLDESLSQPGRKPVHVVDKRETARILSNYLNATEDEIFKILDQPDRKQVEFGAFGRKLSHEKKTLIEAEELPGIIFFSDTKRYYPNGSFASYLIGYAREEEIKDERTNKYKLRTVGEMGLEAYYDKLLEGTDGYENYEADRRGYLLPGATHFIEEPRHGFNMKLTLDKTIQNFVDDALLRAYEKYTPEEMVVVVADPKTGGILAMSQSPAFNPNTREELNSQSIWLNQATSDTIEPGSTMKVFTLATAIETGNWTPNSQYKSGQYRMPNSMRIVRDHNGVGWGTISFLEGIQRSSNVAVAYMMERIGTDTFLQYLEKFGFGQKTGFPVSEEASGVILNKNKQDIISTAFGQASTVTPLQLVQGMTAIANDGVMMKPYIVENIVDPNTGEVIEENKPTEQGRPISPETAEQVRTILASTVTAPAGTAKQFKIDNYNVAGKTGTAQIVNENGTYDWGAEEFLYSFLGMAPVENPQLIVYVAVQKPKLDGVTGSTPVSEVFKSVMENSLKYLNIDPANIEAAEKTELANYVGSTAQEAKVQLEERGIKAVITGEGGRIEGQYPAAGTTVVEGDRVFIKTAGTTILPDFTGWSLRHLKTFEQLANIRIELEGAGYVISQDMKAGSVIVENGVIRLQLQTPEEQYTVEEVLEEEVTDETDDVEQTEQDDAAEVEEAPAQLPAEEQSTNSEQ